MKNKFKIGDIVCINHSDVLLTIIEDEQQTGKAGYYKVCWFNEAGDFSTAILPQEALREEVKEVVMQADAS